MHTYIDTYEYTYARMYVTHIFTHSTHKSSLLLHSCCCTRVVALVLLHSCCYTRVVALVLLHSCCCTRAVTLVLLHSCCCTPLLHSCCYTHTHLFFPRTSTAHISTHTHTHTQTVRSSYAYFFLLHTSHRHRARGWQNWRRIGGSCQSGLVHYQACTGQSDKNTHVYKYTCRS